MSALKNLVLLIFVDVPKKYSTIDAMFSLTLSLIDLPDCALLLAEHISINTLIISYGFPKRCITT